METGIAMIAFADVAFFSPFSRRPSEPRAKAEKPARRSILTTIGTRLSRAADRPAAWTPRVTNYPY